jgi:TldD protein
MALPQRIFAYRNESGSEPTNTGGEVRLLVTGKAKCIVPEEVLKKVLRTAMLSGADFAEVFVEDTSTETITMEDGKIENVNSGRDRGAGVRVVKGETSSYCYTDSLEENALLEAARTAAGAVSGARGEYTIDLTRREVPVISPIAKYPWETTKAVKADLLLRADKVARAYDPLIRQVTGALLEIVRNTTIANSEGILAADSVIRSRFNVGALAAKNGVMQTGSATIGKGRGLEILDIKTPEDLGKEAARQAIVNVHARPAPSGPMTVVMTNGWGGVLFHEACGHSLEADGILRGSSVFAGKIGQKVANECVTAVDDATIPNEWGSFGVDDEGNPGKKTVLIENGILTSYMYDRKSAAKGKHEFTGNGRRQSYRYIAIPRMTNTFIAPHSSRAEDILADTPDGLYAKGLRGGQVNSATGDFVFNVSEAYLIKNGKLDDAVRGATLVGNGLRTLGEIDAVANDLDFGPGNCGKGGQSVPAACGQPALRIRRITVGGTQRRSAERRG